MNEQKLINGCKKGHSWAQKSLYEHYAPLMMSVCLRYVRDKNTAQDVLQEGFIKIFNRVHTYTGVGVFEAWIYRVFVTTALEYLRQNKHLKFKENIDNYENTIENNDYSIIEKISADDLLECIANLPDGYRTVFNLFAIEGYSHQEIAEMLKIEVSTSRSQYLRARQALQKSIISLKVQEYAER